MASESVPTLISELAFSDSDDDRMKIKEWFTEQFQVLDTKLNLRTHANADNLSKVVEITSQTISFLSDSKAKCQSLKQRITACMDMLKCKQDQIRKLWIDSLEHKYAHQMLAEIAKLVKTKKKVNDCLHAKKYLCATEVLVSSISLLEGDFGNIEALNELRFEMNRLKETLYMIFVEELKLEIFWSAFRVVFGTPSDNNDKSVTYEKIFKNRDLKVDPNITNLNSSYVKMILECLTLLQKLPETLEIVRNECQYELSRIVKKLSKFMFDVLQRSCDQSLFDLPESHQQDFLVDLLQTILDHFKCIALNFRLFLQILGNTAPTLISSDTDIQVSDIYSGIQATIEEFVSAYLEQQSSSNMRPHLGSSVLSSSQKLCDLSNFFVIHGDKESSTLFKFANSSEWMRKNKKTVLSEPVRKVSVTNKGKILKSIVLVCRPSAKNITVLFVPLKVFASEMESLLSIEYCNNCLLRSFLYDCANVFLDQVNSEINRILEMASISLDSWSMSPIPGDETVSEKNILSSTLILNKNLKELQLLITSLPDYSNHFLHLIYYIILDYKDMLQRAFKNLFDDDHNILSVSWAKDRDIRRLLKSFSNWKHLEDEKTADSALFPEEVRLRNKEESRLLIRNLHSEEHGQWEIITNLNVLFNLAVLQESSQWFSVELLNFMSDFESANIGEELPPTSLSAITGLKRLVKEYEDFADVCLLALHLEVRAHCFHYLLPPSSEIEIPFEVFFSQGFEQSVHSLTADLAKIDEILQPVLTAKEQKYIFEGVGELVASILIHNVSDMKVASDDLVKKMTHCIFIIQCCLSNITLAREVALERTRHYIQLLNQTCEDILNDILQEGPKFSETEYISIFKLILGNHESKDVMLNEYISKLQKIFKRISVTI